MPIVRDAFRQGCIGISMIPRYLLDNSDEGRELRMLGLAFQLRFHHAAILSKGININLKDLIAIHKRMAVFLHDAAIAVARRFEPRIFLLRDFLFLFNTAHRADSRFFRFGINRLPCR